MKYSAFESRKPQPLDPDLEAQKAAFFASGKQAEQLQPGETAYQAPQSRKQVDDLTWKKRKETLQ